MIYFLDKLSKEIINKYNQLDKLTIIFPGNTSIIQFKKYFYKLIDKKNKFPELLSMQNFMKKISNLSLIKTTSLLFISYKLAKKYIDNFNESFENFLTWAPKALEDFSDLDLNMINIDKFFVYMSSIKQISKWEIKLKNFDKNKRISFWITLSKLYKILKIYLLSKKLAYKGLIYRQAIEKIENFILKIFPEKYFLFIGINFLSKSEEDLIQYLINQKKAKIYWDIDEYFLDSKQKSNEFIKEYIKKWKYLKEKKIQWISNDFKKQKFIEVIGVPSQIGQAKEIGIILKKLVDKKYNFSKTAIIFSEPSLLSSFIHYIPKGINKINININESLKNTYWNQLFELIFRIFLNQKKSKNKEFYYKDLIELLSERHLKYFFHFKSEKLIKKIQKENLIFVSNNILNTYLKKSFFLDILSSDNLKPKKYIEMLLRLINELKKKNSLYKKTEVKFSSLKIFEKFFKSLIPNISHLLNISELRIIYKKWITSKSCNYLKKFNKGLQLLEIHKTLLLDFETVIITSMNEEIFPPKKNNNSWIPFDIRLKMKLPIHYEQDKKYTYYFYHLIQRSKYVFLIYNTQENELGSGEKSRFIYQLDIESPHKLIYKISSPLPEFSKKNPICIFKTPYMLNHIKKIATYGFSPSSLSLYIKNPIIFYKTKVLNIKKQKKVEEIIENDIHGNIIHKSLEKLYRPLINKSLNLKDCIELRKKIKPVVNFFLQKIYKENYLKGKNLLIYQIIKKQIEEFVNWEEINIRNNKNIRIKFLEEKFSMNFKLSDEIHFYGKIDRIDEYNEKIRIIDYKSGYISPLSLKLNSKNIEIILNDIRFDKELQLLLYICLYYKSNKFLSQDISSYIFSFRKIKNGLIPLIINSKTKINKDFIELFLSFLSKKILEILDPKIPFKEKINLY